MLSTTAWGRSWSTKRVPRDADPGGKRVSGAGQPSDLLLGRGLSGSQPPALTDTMEGGTQASSVDMGEDSSGHASAGQRHSWALPGHLQNAVVFYQEGPRLTEEASTGSEGASCSKGAFPGAPWHQAGSGTGALGVLEPGEPSTARSGGAKGAGTAARLRKKWEKKII